MTTLITRARFYEEKLRFNPRIFDVEVADIIDALIIKCNQASDNAIEFLGRLEEAEGDTNRLQGLCKHAEWDGYGYWLPEWCIKERDSDFYAYRTPDPTIDELREAIDTKIAEKEMK